MVSTDDTLALDAVVQRFDASKDTLDKLAEKLQGLDLVHQSKLEEKKALSEASATLSTVAQELLAFVKELGPAVATMRGVTESASAALNATDAKALTDAIDAMASEIKSGVHSEIAAVGKEIRSSTAGAMESIAKDSGEASKLAGSISDRMEQFEQRVVALEKSMAQSIGELGQRFANLEDARNRERALEISLGRVKANLKPSQLKKLGLD